MKMSLRDFSTWGARLRRTGTGTQHRRRLHHSKLSAYFIPVSNSSLYCRCFVKLSPLLRSFNKSSPIQRQLMRSLGGFHFPSSPESESIQTACSSSSHAAGSACSHARFQFADLLMWAERRGVRRRSSSAGKWSTSLGHGMGWERKSRITVINSSSLGW